MLSEKLWSHEMPDLNLTKQLLIRLLSSSSSPELGARLKQRLNAAFIANGFGPFDEGAFGYQRFKDFLSQGLQDILIVTRENESTDILVSLKTSPHSTPGGQVTAATPSVGLQPVIRSDVWQAFSNPDIERKRFLNNKTLAVIHFRNKAGTPELLKREVESSPDNFIEIKPIAADLQFKWMTEFLDSLRLSPNEKTSLETLTKEPYSSALNATFTRALGDHGVAWRNFRTKQVVSHIESWCKQQSISFWDLCVQARHQGFPSAPVVPATAPPLSARQHAMKLLDLLTDEDISRLVIPTLLSTILVKSRL